MDTKLLVIYISVLLTILGSTSWFIVRQILKTRKIEMSLERLENKLTTEKGTVEEYYELGSIYVDKKLYSQAIVLFQKALKSKELEGEEDLAVLYNALGFAHFGQEQYDIAIRQYKEALKLQPQYVTSLNNLGHAYERKKLTAQALEIYEQALTYDPENATAKGRVESLRKRLVIYN
ncbi:tetratricopeptide repeat protein [Microcoleus sp. herbarium12]|jgi:tetratricopeptide (TPR) repeat protein|uniref:tetratricopeptide repeat protein n=1 Tax=Microcoleus sp. herbarium12 TaxID=3055437 RepID=UPI002FD0C92B